MIDLKKNPISVGDEYQWTWDDDGRYPYKPCKVKVVAITEGEYPADHDACLSCTLQMEKGGDSDLSAYYVWFARWHEDDKIYAPSIQAVTLAMFIVNCEPIDLKIPPMRIGEGLSKPVFPWLLIQKGNSAYYRTTALSTPMTIQEITNTLWHGESLIGTYATENEAIQATKMYQLRINDCDKPRHLPPIDDDASRHALLYQSLKNAPVGDLWMVVKDGMGYFHAKMYPSFRTRDLGEMRKYITRMELVAIHAKPGDAINHAQKLVEESVKEDFVK